MPNIKSAKKRVKVIEKKTLRNNMSKNKKNIEIVDGDGSNLEISHVYDHLNSGKPKCDDKKPKNIVIPASHKDKEKK